MPRYQYRYPAFIQKNILSGGLQRNRKGLRTLAGTIPSMSQSVVNAPRDVLVRARKGDGNIFAYLIPAIESRLNDIEHPTKPAGFNVQFKTSRIAGSASHEGGRSAVGSLVLVPTRESAIQVARDLQKLTTHKKHFEVQLLVGGAGKARQMEDWTESSRDLVVTTPGRLRDLLTNEPEFRKRFKNCPMLIVDEADTHLSMGFRDDIEAIVSFLPRPPVCQTLLFSTTMPRAVRQLASQILSANHEFVDAAPPGLTPYQDAGHTTGPMLPRDALATHDCVEQSYMLCPTASGQFPTLWKLLVHDHLTHGSKSKVIVFCPTVQMMELFTTLLRSLLQEALLEDTTEIVTMHSKMRRSDRARARELFHGGGKTQDRKPIVLVTSDASAIGRDVTSAIQLGIPRTDSIYTHRIRRIRRIHSFAPGEAKNNNTPVVHVNLLLLPWEAGYMKWQLTNHVIKLLPNSTLDNQITSLSTKPSALTDESLKSTLTEIQCRISPANIRSAAASLLGYYLPLVPPLRLEPSAVLAGVSSWASECFNVTIPAITRFPRRFTEAYERSTQSQKTKSLFVDGLQLTCPSPLGKSLSRNHSVWEGRKIRGKKIKRWY